MNHKKSDKFNISRSCGSPNPDDNSDPGLENKEFEFVAVNELAYPVNQEIEFFNILEENFCEEVPVKEEVTLGTPSTETNGIILKEEVDIWDSAEESKWAVSSVALEEENSISKKKAFCLFVKSKDKYSNESNTARQYTGLGKFICPLCKEIFTSNSSLLGHLDKHIAEQRFKCTECSFRCSYNSILRVHMRTHSGIKPFTCPYCSCSYTYRPNLYKHMRTHTGEKPFSCCYCGFRCAHKAVLDIHMRTHGKKPFSCQYCKYKCSQKSNILAHISTHTGEKPFSCVNCNYSCLRKGDLTKHERKHTEENSF